MSQPPPNPPPDPAIPRLMRALEKAGVSSVCPACEVKARWVPFDRMVSLPKSQATDFSGYACLGVTCANCGFVRLHRAGDLDQYMDPR